MPQPNTQTWAPDADPGRAGVAPGWLLLLAAALLPFMLLAFYNYPSIHDDYTNANQLLKLGPVGYMHNLYAHWTGRYSEVLLKAYLNPLAYQRTALLAHLQPVAIIALLVAGFYTFFGVLLGRVPASLLLAGALLATVLYLNGFEMVGATIYWFGGYTSYTAGVIASLFAFAGMLALYRGGGSLASQAGRFLVAGFFSAVAVGAYDVCLMALLWVAGSAAVASWWARHPARWWFSLLLVVVLASVYFSMSAPGNQERALSAGRNLSQLVKSPQVIILLVKSGYFAFTQSITWANSLSLLLGTVLLAGLLLRVPGALPAGVGRPPLVLLAVWLLAGLSATIFPSILVYQTVWPHSWQCVYFYFLLGWGWLVLLAVGRYRSRVPGLLALGSGRGWAGLAAFFGGLCLLGSASNTHLAYLELATTGPKYYARVRQREQVLQTSALQHAPAVELQPLYAYDDTWMLPKDLYTHDFSMEDARQYATYYALDSVIVRPLPYHP